MSDQPSFGGAEMIAAERARQVDAEGWTAEHDRSHGDQSLAWAAASYAAPDLVFRRTGFESAVGHGPRRNAGRTAYTWTFRDPWPWVNGDKREPRPWPDREVSKGPNVQQRIRELAKAGALIAAEIDRLQSLAAVGQKDSAA